MHVQCYRPAFFSLTINNNPPPTYIIEHPQSDISKHSLNHDERNKWRSLSGNRKLCKSKLLLTIYLGRTEHRTNWSILRGSSGTTDDDVTSHRVSIPFHLIISLRKNTNMFLKVFVGVIFRKLVPIVSVVVIPFGDDKKALHEYVDGIFRKSAFYRIATTITRDRFIYLCALNHMKMSRNYNANNINGGLLVVGYFVYEYCGE